MKNFEITEDNKPYLESRGKIILNACPGSGKTSAIAYKLTTLTQECEITFGNFAGIACLSFTNVAKSEIATKYYSISNVQLSYPHEVLTLDSFINRYITLPFYYLLEKSSKRPTIMDSVFFLDTMNLGYFASKSKIPINKIYRPSKLKLEMDGSISWDGHSPDQNKVDLSTFNRYARTFKEWQLDNGYLDNDDSTFIAHKLLKSYPQIAKTLIKRFPYIIIDEAQDTSEIQYAIFDLLIDAGLSNIEFVGDPYQSLYEFREARPDLFINRFRDKENWQPFIMKDCRRTTQRIIETYSIFRGKQEAPIVSTCKHKSDNSIKVIRYDPNNLPDLINRYETLIDPILSNQILVRGSTHLEMFGVKPSSEKPWKNDLANSLVEAKRLYELGNTKNAIDTLRKFLVEAQLPSANHKERLILRDQLKEDININIQLFEFLREMPTIDDSLIGWTEKVTEHIFKKFNLTIGLELKQKGKAFYQLNLKSILSPGMNLSFPVNTIHKVKGMTFQSILLVLSENSSAANISLNDFTKPDDLPSEKQRMIYVALSRPEILACIAVPNAVTEDYILRVLGKDIEFV